MDSSQTFLGSLPLPSPPFSDKENLLVGLSGGSDSTALLHLLAHQLPKASARLMAIHVNYGLRGRESDRDEAAARALCGTWKIPFRVLKLKKFKWEARREKRSLQDWARERRYSFFARLARREKAWGVAVAHHQEDQAETLLDRLLRGAGTRGLTGLRPVQELTLSKTTAPLKIWRPLLAYPKTQLETYLRSRRIAWREDRSNQESHYRRNQIRNRIIPYLARWNPRISETLAKWGEISGAEDVFLTESLRNHQRDLRNHWSPSSYSGREAGFVHMPLALQRRWVRQVAERLNPDARGLSFDRIEDMVRVWTGRKKGPSDMGYGLVVDQRKGRLWLTFHAK